jgi:hypothetical protein
MLLWYSGFAVYARSLPIFIFLVLLAACGTPGAPQPPSLRLPKTVEDLEALRKGDHVYLSWTMPQKTTDGQNIRHAGTVLVCRAVTAFKETMPQCTKLAEMPAKAVSAPDAKAVEAEFTDALPVELQLEHETGFATYAVEVLNENGRSAGLSNQAQVPLGSTLPPPTDLSGQVTPQGILLTWTADPSGAHGLNYVYRIYRSIAGNNAEAVVVGDVPLRTETKLSLMDRSLEYGTPYLYQAAAVRALENQPGVEIEGDDSAALALTPRDTFPPATPSGVEAVFSGPGQQAFIDLIWSPNMESDLAGYHVYRQGREQTAVRIDSQMVSAPAFRDQNVEAGTTYRYFITAVDVRGNESARSGAASETVPATR